jgi:hypothetical protein
LSFNGHAEFVNTFLKIFIKSDGIKWQTGAKSWKSQYCKDTVEIYDYTKVLSPPAEV